MDQPLYQSLALVRKGPVTLHAQVRDGVTDRFDTRFYNSPGHHAIAGSRNVFVNIHPEDLVDQDQPRQTHSRHGLRFYQISDHGLCDWKVVSHLLRICRKEHITIWHSYDSRTRLLGLLLQKYWPLRLVTDLDDQGDHDTGPLLYGFIDKLCLPHYEKVICNSLDGYEQARTSGVPADRCVLIEAAIDPAEYTRRRSREEAKVHLGMHPRRFVIGTVGEFATTTQLDLLIRAVTRLLDEQHDLELIIVGEKRYRSNLDRLISHSGYRKRIRLVDCQSSQRDYYESMDMLVCTEPRQRFLNVLLVTLALEVPVLAMRCGYIARIITSGINGIMIEPGSVEELRDKLDELIQNPGLCQELGYRGKELVEKFYSTHVRMRRVQAVYEEVSGREHCSDGKLLGCL